MCKQCSFIDLFWLIMLELFEVRLRANRRIFYELQSVQQNDMKALIKKGLKIKSFQHSILYCKSIEYHSILCKFVFFNTNWKLVRS